LGLDTRPVFDAVDLVERRFPREGQGDRPEADRKLSVEGPVVVVFGQLVSVQAGRDSLVVEQHYRR
jgi:hypothetical protein